MRNQVLNVNTDAIIHLTAKLERLNKYAFPSAVRSTLNDSAFIMKKKNILASAKVNMTVRNPSFFRKFTGVEKAKGKDIDSMFSKVGFINTDPDPKKGQKAIIGMEHNEVGGSDNKGAWYLRKTRGQNSLKRKVQMAKRFNKGNLSKRHLGHKNNSSVLAMISSFEEGKPVFIRSKLGIGYVVQVNKVDYEPGGKNRKISVDFLMRSRSKKEAKAKATHFNQEAAIKTSKQIEAFYIKNSEYQFNKVLKSKI